MARLYRPDSMREVWLGAVTTFEMTEAYFMTGPYSIAFVLISFFIMVSTAYPTGV
jgi:hypothetical protein